MLAWCQHYGFVIRKVTHANRARVIEMLFFVFHVYIICGILKNYLNIILVNGFIVNIILYFLILNCLQLQIGAQL